MHTTDLGTQNTHRAYFAYFLAQVSGADHRITHQLLNNAQRVQADYSISDLAASQIIDQAHAAAKAELA